MDNKIILAGNELTIPEDIPNETISLLSNNGVEFILLEELPDGSGRFTWEGTIHPEVWPDLVETIYGTEARLLGELMRIDLFDNLLRPAFDYWGLNTYGVMLN